MNQEFSVKPQKAALLLFIGMIGAIGLIFFNRNAGSVPYGSGVYVVSSWSPDSQRLLFSFDGGFGEEAWIYNVTTNEYSRLNLFPETPFLRGGSSWLAKDVVYLAARGTTPERMLSEVNVNSGEHTNVQIFTGEWSRFSINPVNKSTIYATNGESRELYCLYILLDFRSPQDKFGQCTTQSEDSPLWSLDGKWLASIYRDGLIIRDAHGNEKKRIPVNIKGGPSNMAWSSDSNSILFIGNYDAPGLYLVGIDDNPIAGLIKSGAFSYVSLSPDNRWIAYTTVGSPGENTLHIEEFNP